MSIETLRDGIERGQTHVLPRKDLQRLDRFLPGIDRAPILVQFLARGWFDNAVQVALLGSACLVCMALIAGPVQSAIVGTLFIALLIRNTFRLERLYDPMTVPAETLIVIVFLAVGLAAFSTLVPLQNPVDVQIPNLRLTVAMLFVVHLATAIMFVVAIRSHFGPTYKSVAACEPRRFATQSLPDDLFAEARRQLDRLGSGFADGRIYLEVAPRVDASREFGSFDAELIAESAPSVDGSPVPSTVASILGSPSLALLAAITAMAGICWLFAFLAIWWLTQNLEAGQGVGALMIWIVALVAIARYSQQSAHLLWARIDYLSLLVRVRMSGNFSTASLAVGNIERGGMQSRKRVIDTENLEVLVWVTNLRSHSFGIEGVRAVTAYLGDKPKCRLMMDGLADFLDAQASIVGPQTDADLRRAADFGRASRLISGQPPDDLLPPPRLDPDRLAGRRPNRSKDVRGDSEDGDS